jgi:nucleotide-binding universal stress UspA family protein
MSVRIVLATRYGQESAEPARVATRLARQLDGRLTIAYVATELQAATAGAAEAGLDPALERQHQLEHMHAELKRFVEGYFPNMHVELRILEGDVAGSIADLAREIAADFIVVGTRGRSGLARLMLGDTTQEILQRTPCPVIVVPLRS